MAASPDDDRQDPADPRSDLRHQIHRLIDRLPPHRLPSTSDFVLFLLDQESEAVTHTLMALPTLLADLELAEQDVTEGHVFSWEEVGQRYR